MYQNQIRNNIEQLKEIGVLLEGMTDNLRDLLSEYCKDCKNRNICWGTDFDYADFNPDNTCIARKNY
jgi:hypothetical protein